MAIAYHGIGAYRRDLRGSLLKMRAALKMIIAEQVEICAADRPIGGFGVIVDGDITAAFDCDVMSYISQSTGRRYATVDREEEEGPLWAMYAHNVSSIELAYNCRGISRPGSREWIDFARRASDGQHRRHYCECWLDPVAIRAIWVKSWASPKVKAAAAMMAANRGLPLLVVDGRDRIWGAPQDLPYWYGQAKGAAINSLGEAFDRAA